MWRKFTWTLTSPPPQPSDVTLDVHVTQVNMNVNIPTPQPSDVTLDVHVTQVNMNVNIPTPPTQWRNVRCACYEWNMCVFQKRPKRWRGFPPAG